MTALIKAWTLEEGVSMFISHSRYYRVMSKLHNIRISPTTYKRRVMCRVCDYKMCARRAITKRDKRGSLHSEASHSAHYIEAFQ